MIPVTTTSPPIDGATLKKAIADEAYALGFDLVGFTSASPFPEARAVLQQRIDAGFFSGLPWFSPERAEIASDPANLMPAVRSMVSLGLSYRGTAERVPSSPGAPRGRVARYAWGRDYHDVFREKLRALLGRLEVLLGRPIDSRALADTARIVDRAVAQRAGVGWYGKNTNILNRRFGSWVLLGELLLDFDLPPDEPVRTHCGSCTRCLPSCPTGALVAPGVLINDLCISYLTIELKGPIPRHLRVLVGDWVFGCDLCQDACPVNVKAEGVEHPDFAPELGIGPSPQLLQILAMTEGDFRERFRHSPVKRAKLAGLQRNACVALGNIGDPAALPSLGEALRSPSALVRGHAAWALGRIGGKSTPAILAGRLANEEDAWVREEIALALDELVHLNGDPALDH